MIAGRTIAYSLLIISALALSAHCAWADQTRYWNFDDGTSQGWSVEKGSGHLSPTVDATVDFGQWGAAQSVNNTGALYLPDNHYAWLEVAPTNSFTFSAMVGFNFTNPYGVVSNSKLAASGLGYHVSEAGGYKQDVTAWFEGNINKSEQLLFKDTKCVNNNTELYGGLLKNATGDVFPGIGIMTIDYNHEVAGHIVLKYTSLNYASKTASPFTATYSYEIGRNSFTGEYCHVDSIRLGGQYSWAQAFYDNVAFTDYGNYAVPEPASISLIAAGLAGIPLAHRKRRS